MSLFNNINDEESTSTISSKVDSSNSQQKITGQPFNSIWKHFNQLQDLKQGFKIPSSKTLAGRIFNKQII
ncbi:15142_t:CDS:2 [Gigaspora margarita]|uniref:15142_t:CDS:1 n=1 Tax=Gigaspora margarita TaxID=4874 RepID=A0ABN7VU78_GIGMA|nr:15142_t:CDS:2 [Gigaspora margarita]